MSRTSKGITLYRQPTRYDAKGDLRARAMWVIRDGQRKISTGICAENSKQPPQEAQEALARYIVQRYQPSRERNNHSTKIIIDDVLSIYLQDKGKLQARPSELAGRAERLLSYWSCKTLDKVTGSTCREYVEFRGKAGAARRELQDLQAAINYYHAKALNLATQEQIDIMEKYALKINDILQVYLAERGILLVDFKLEFGVHKGQVILGDEISPDTCRLWDRETKQKLDKDRFRRDLGNVEDAYREILKRLTGEII